jgi:tRNA threonylcarbamoyladenosine biosynthesis protein TsaE
LTRGIAEGLGVTDPSAVSSPSFTLVNSYQGWCRIYHVDLYRLEGERDFYSTGLEDFLGIDGITIIEWSERLNFPVTGAVTVNIRDLGGESRKITVSETVSGRRHGRIPAATGRRVSTRWRRK